MKKLQRIVYLLLINVGLLILMLALIEVSSRTLLNEKESKALFNDQDLRVRGRPFVEHHPSRGFSLKPNFKNNLYSIDKYGFRSVKSPKYPTNSYTILALGESTTFGWGVADHETYPYILTQSLQQTMLKPQVINGGIPSYTSAQVLAYLSEILDNNVIQPNMILVNILWNDIWYSTIENWHKDLLIYQKPPSWLVYLTQHSRFFNTLIMGFSYNSHKEKVDLFNKKALDYYAENIKAIIEKCQKENIPLVFVQPPFDADHMAEEGLNEFHIRYSKPFFIKMSKIYLDTLAKVAQSYHIPIISHQLDIRYLHQKTLFLDALHPTSEGNRIMAEDIAIELKKILPHSTTDLQIQNN